MKQSYHKILILFSLLFFSLKADAQEETPFHTIFTTEDGLPSNRVYDIMQDSKGYIWAGTETGLVRFNGKEFKEYTTVESVNPEYSYLHELKDGSIWCINFGNQVLKISGDSLKVVDAFKPYINDKKYFQLHQWKDSLLYIENQNRILEYDPFNHSLKEILSDDFGVFNFFRNQQYIYYSRGNDGSRVDFIYSLENQSKDTTTYQHPTWTKTYHSNGFSFLYASIGGRNLEGHLFPLHSANIPPLKKENSILKTEQSHLNTVSSVTYFNEDDIWMSTRNGAFNTLRKKPLFPNNSITRIIKDSEENYWLSTLNSGIILIPNLNLNQVNQFKNGISQINKFSESELLLGATAGNLFIYDIDNDEIKKSIDLGLPASRPLIFLNNKTRLLTHSNLPFLINPDNKKDPVIKSKRFSIKSYTRIDEQHIIVQNTKNALSIFHEDIWSTSPKSVDIALSDVWISIDNNRIGNHFHKTLKFRELNIENIHFEKKEKRIWIAFTNKTAIEHQQTFNYFYDKDGNDIQLNCFADHMDQGIIAAKRNHGFVFIEGNDIVFNTSHKKYEEFGAIRKILTTDSMIISLAKKGIIVSNKDGIPLYTLDETDGFKGSIINHIEFNSNRLWIGTNKGLYNIHINDFHDNLISPKVYINKILINNEIIDLSPTEFPSFPNNSDVEINYEALCFKGRKFFHYEYKLRQDEEWKTLSSSSNSIRFPNLSSGKYQFQIKAINEEGIKGNSAILNFKILPPIWLRWWFILGCIIIISLILFFYNKKNLERIEKENLREKEQIERENKLQQERVERENKLQQEIRSNKLSALQSRMNPHFIFNSLNSIQDFIIRLDKEGANEYLGIFSDLMRIYLSHSEKDNIEIQEEIEALQLYLKLEELRFGDIIVDFNIDHELKRKDIHLPPLFIQPYIENAFKHGLLHKKEDKKLMIAFKLVEQQLIIHIKDNGVGRAKVKEIQNKTSVKGLSYSTKANQTRLELLNHNRTSKIKVNTIDLYQDAASSGTLVEIIIPLQVI